MRVLRAAQAFAIGIAIGGMIVLLSACGGAGAGEDGTPEGSRTAKAEKQ